jgi:mevalonate kinase
MNSILDGNEMELGNMLTENHKLLLRLGVSHPKIEKLIENCLDNGALGAKLTGAGKGGSMIALMPNDRSIEISTKISRGSDKWMLVEFDYDGVVFG